MHNVAVVHRPFFFRRLHVARDDDANRHAEELVNLAHPLGIASREIIVHRDDVDASPSKGVQIRRKRCNERFAFASLHFGDPAKM